MKPIGECCEDARIQAEQTLAAVESFLQPILDPLTPAELAFSVQTLIESQAGDEFQLAFSTSDAIVSKGLAAYRTLRERPAIL